MKQQSAKIMLVDDDPGFLRLLTLRLESAGHKVRPEESAASALVELSGFQPNLVITDLRMDEMNGIGLLSELQKRSPGLPVLILSAHGTIPDAVTATQTGAFAFLTKPVDHHELYQQINAALRVSGVTDASDNWRSEIVTRSPLMEELLATAKHIAATDNPILVTGPSGTGKEVFSRAIHKASGREGPFVAFNCAAIPMDLLESELFGYQKGAFTGATRNHAGLFQQADKGTLLLDEIGEMPAAVQAKLLRVLEDGQVRPLGGDRSIQVDARIISATNKDLPGAISSGDFREDLYYRLNTVTFELPPLADRIEDIPALVIHHLQGLAEKKNTSPKSFSPESMEQLLSYHWPGNVRQLYNVVDQTAALSTSSVIGPEIVKKALGVKSTSLPSLAQAREEFMRGYLIQLLAATQGNVSQAARLAQRNRTDFYKLLGKHDIDAAAFKPR